MGYSEQVLRRARERLEQAKQERARENEAHRREAYERYPRLEQIDRELQTTMAQLVAATLRHGEDPAEAVAQIREKNLALQREREWILEAGDFEEGYLDDAPVCSKCGGSGYVGSTMCECLRELCRQEQKKEVSILSGSKESFNQFRLDYYPDRVDPQYGASPRTIMERNFQNCRRYAATFNLNAGNLLFVGGTGLGKTFLSACIARTVADRGYSVVYETAAHLFGKLEKARFNPTEESRREAEKFTACDLLIVDDLGTEMPGQFVTASLYSLLNDRMLAGRPMVVSTNLNVDEVSRRYTPQIASRLYGGFQRLTFVGEDIRVLKNRGY